MVDTASFTKMVPGFDFLQNLVKGAGSALPSIGQWVAPTLDPEELEKRIEELRTVQFWLEQNARMLGATIQALEVQRMTLATLKGQRAVLNSVLGISWFFFFGALFLAGVIPGLTLAGLFMLTVIGWAILVKARIPAPDAPMNLFQKIYAARHLIPSVALIVMTVGYVILSQQSDANLDTLLTQRVKQMESLIQADDREDHPISRRK